MSTYKGIQGFGIQNRSSDPTTFITGQVWYNSTDQVFKVTISGTDVPDSWATGGNLATARRGLGGSGTPTASLAFGGQIAPPTGPVVTSTEEYNGSSWTAGGAMGTGRYNLASAVKGTQTSSLAFGGAQYPASPPSLVLTEEYDGSSWTAGGALNTGTQSLGGAGTQTAGLAFGGFGVNGGSPFDGNNNTEEYNGTSWTVGNVMSQIRMQNCGTGLQTAAIAVGGYDRGTSTALTVCEEYDGTNWSTAPGALNVAKYQNTAAGTQTTAITAGGSGPNVTQLYDGTSWRSTTGMNSSKTDLASAGTQPAMVVFGGSFFTNQTEEFTLGNPAIRTITTT